MLATTISRPLCRRSNFLIAVLATCWFSSAAVAAASQAGVAFLKNLSISVSPAPVVTVCHGFGCAYRNQLVLTPAKFAYLRGMLQAARSAGDERKIIARTAPKHCAAPCWPT